MLTKIILFAVVAACGVPSIPATADPPAEQPDKLPPEEPEVKDQHFCCQTVDQKNLTGDGCNTIAPTQIDACANVLYCEGNWSKKEGHVVCE